MLVLLLALPAAARADDQRWGLSLWGLSYHVDRSVDYNEDNWGLGLRYYFKPDRFFVEVDALRNSNRGLVLPLSAGAEFRIAPLPAGCSRVWRSQRSRSLTTSTRTGTRPTSSSDRCPASRSAAAG